MARENKRQKRKKGINKNAEKIKEKIKWEKKNLKNKLILNKKIGKTPLQVLENFKENNPKYKNTKLAYAGRLDPLANGKLLILVGEECKKRDKYLSLDKEYIFEILLDFKSDSQDVLGIPKFSKDSHQKTKKIIDSFFDEKNEENFKFNFNKNLKKSFLGKKTFKYPIYSSKAVNGKPLFLWSLENRINEIKIPTKNIEIYKINFISKKEIEKKVLEEEIFEKINSIKKVTEKSKTLGNDFRRDEIKKEWKKIFSKIKNDEKFLILKIKIIASSGTYMRTLAEKISKEIFDSFGLAFSIERTRIGKNYKNFLWNFFRDIK